MKEIKIQHIFKSYGEKPILNDFSAVLLPGKITALMAPSGAGKTTLLRLLMGLEAPDSGTVEGLEDAKISVVFQEDRLCPELDPVANIRLVNPKISRERAEKALEAVGLGNCTRQKSRELSGGMQRRVAILRALMAEYDFLLLDEPFRGLDADTKALVMADTLRRCQGKTVLLVTHDPTEPEKMQAQCCLHL